MAVHLQNCGVYQLNATYQTPQSVVCPTFGGLSPLLYSCVLLTTKHYSWLAPTHPIVGNPRPHCSTLVFSGPPDTKSGRPRPTPQFKAPDTVTQLLCFSDHHTPKVAFPDPPPPRHCRKALGLPILQPWRLSRRLSHPTVWNHRPCCKTTLWFTQKKG